MENSKTPLYLGIIAPLVFIFTTFYVASLHPTYSHYSSFISELGANGMPYSYLANIGIFYIHPFLLFVFAIKLPNYIQYNGKLSTSATILFCIHAVGINGGGIFSCDLGCTPVNPTLTQDLHNLTAGVGIPALTISILLWGIIFNRLNHKALSIFSFIIFTVTLISFLWLGQTIEDRSGTGLFQRITLFSQYIWVIAIALTLIKQGRLTSASNRT